MNLNRKTLLTTLLCALGAAALPTPALADGEAAYVTRSANTLGFHAYYGFHNDVTVTMDGNYVVFRDASGPILASNGCQWISGAGAKCLLAAGTHLSIGLGNGANKVKTDLPDDDLLSIWIYGGDESSSNRIEHVGRPATLTGGPGDDTIIGGFAADEIDGLGGHDVLQPRSGRDDVDGGPGVDLTSYADHIVGGVRVSLDGQANDGYLGENDNVKTENVVGGGRGDVITGSSVANMLNGAGGRDEVHGGSGADEVYGGADHDTLEGGAGDDMENGGAGDDMFLANPGADRMIGSLGYDTANYAARTSPIVADLDSQPDDGVEAEGDNAQVEHLTGGSGNDDLTGNSAANILRGGSGNDRIEGRGGKDSLFAEAGADNLLAQDGVAELVDCGADTDTFAVDAGDETVACAGPAGNGDGDGTGGGSNGPGTGPGATGAAPRLAISPRRPRLDGKRIVLRVRCPRTADVACTGRLRLVKAGGTAGSKRFRIAAGRTARVPIRVEKGTRLAVAAKGSLRVKLAVSVRDADSSAAKSSRTLRLRAAL
jgi:Ca2+-binding RTX toxin-like protein